MEQHDLISKYRNKKATLMAIDNTDHFLERLQASDCEDCDLCQRENRIVTHRGNPDAGIVLVGEGPGKVEDEQGTAFVGPAGQFMDKMFDSVNISTDDDMFCSNVVLCRPTATKGSGKQNDKPNQKQIQACKKHILKIIELINPKIILAAGKTAAIGLFNVAEKSSMKHLVHRFFEWKKPDPLYGRQCAIMYHPSYLLRLKNYDSTAYKVIAQETYNFLKRLRGTAEEFEVLDAV